MRDVHPFYCARKKCRKSAHETPEHLSSDDWLLLAAAVGFFQQGGRAAFDAMFADGKRSNAEAFFYRMIGWPEGLNYYAGGSDAAREQYFRGFVQSDLPKLLEALANRGELQLA